MRSFVFFTWQVFETQCVFMLRAHVSSLDKMKYGPNNNTAFNGKILYTDSIFKFAFK